MTTDYRAWPADLIVKATHGRGGLRRAIRGNVAEALLSESPVALLVARTGGYETKRIATLLVPTDGTPARAVALTVAEPLARMTEARVVLLQVVGNMLQYAGTVAAGRAPVVLDPGWQHVALASACSHALAMPSNCAEQASKPKGVPCWGLSVR